MQNWSSGACIAGGSMEAPLDIASSAVVSIPDLSFATDLLFNVDDVRDASAVGLASHGSVVALIKSRISLERSYALGLQKMAKQSHLDDAGDDTMGEALRCLTAQYLNTSEQHQQLAKNLEEDVLRPIETLHAHNCQQAHTLAKHVNRIKKEAKSQEDAYKKDYCVFEKHFRDASASFTTAMDAGFSSTVLEHQYHRRLAKVNIQEPLICNNRLARSVPSSPHGKVALQTLNNNSQKLVSWLMASEHQRKEDSCNNAVKALEAAEMARRKCQASWQAVEESRIEMYRILQSVLTDYQQMAENRIFSIATNLRKHVVFASSALANEQYDWQMAASKLERVDLEADIRDFILQHHESGKRDSSRWQEMTITDLCVSTASSPAVSLSSKPCHPLKKTQIEIRDVSAKKIPLDLDGSQTTLAELLVTRSCLSNSARPQVLTDNFETLDQAPPSRESISCLRVDCHRSSSNSSNENSFDVATFRVALARDVAQAIERSQAARSERSSLPSKDKKWLSAVLDSGELENNARESPPSSSPHASYTALPVHPVDVASSVYEDKVAEVSAYGGSPEKTRKQ